MRNYGIAVIGMFLQDGVEIVKFDEIKCELYLKVPEDSYAYHKENQAGICDAASYVKRNKECLIEAFKFPDNVKVFYKTYPVCWTKEMGEVNFKQHISEFV